jgi:FkbM family methyltransferase
MNIVHILRKAFRLAGYDLSKLSHISTPIACRRQIFKTYGIDTVLDVGANTGQFAKQLRNEIGYKNRIISFEPLSSAFKILEVNSKKDPLWEIHNFALGDFIQDGTLNIAANSYSSSLLEMLPSHLKSAPESQYQNNEVIKIKTLDSIFKEITVPSKNIYMKIDTQGFESRVLRGSEKSLELIDTIQMEMSLIPLYKDEMLFEDLYNIMKSKEYTLVGIENGFSDKTSGQLLQIDGIFHRF